jgi:RNA polymerase sigma factor (sigma-70 family)
MHRAHAAEWGAWLASGAGVHAWTDLHRATVAIARALNESFRVDEDRMHDVVSESLIRLERHVDDIKPGAGTAWLRTVCSNLLRHAVRDAKRLERSDVDAYGASNVPPGLAAEDRTIVAPDRVSGATTLADTVPQLVLSPEEPEEMDAGSFVDLVAEMASDDMDLACLKRRLSALGREQLYIVRSLLAGASIREIADDLGMRRNAVDQALHRIRLRVAPCRAAKKEVE